MTKNSDFDNNKNKIDKFLKTKLPSSIKGHTISGQKTSGAATGFLANFDSNQYMMKPGEMNISTKDELDSQKLKVINLIENNASEEDINKESNIYRKMFRNVQDKGDMLREYMAPFDRFLYNNSASISIATNEEVTNFKNKQKSPESLYVRSKMIDNFESLDSNMFYTIKLSKDIENETPNKGELLVGLHGSGIDRELVLKNDHGEISDLSDNKNMQDSISREHYRYLSSNPDELGIDIERALKKCAVYKFGYKNSQTIEQAQGLEKILATCMMLGDSDYHGSNLGIVDKEGERFFVKLDHGRAHYFNNDESRLRRELAHRLNQYSYQGMNFDANKLKLAIDEMTNISDSELETIVKKRSYELKRMGYKLDDSLEFFENGELKALSPVSDNAKTDKEKMDSRYENMENNYIDSYKKQRNALSNFSQDLDIVLKLDMPDNWKTREWVHELEGYKPINWAIENQKTIQGIDPKVWGVLSKIREDANIKESEIDPILKIKFYLANKELNKARDEINNIKMVNADSKLIVESIKPSYDSEIINLLDSKILQVEKNSEALWDAVKSGNLQEFTKLIDEIGTPNIKNSKGVSLLHVAVGSGNKELVDILIEKKADLNIDYKGTSALQLAINKGNTEISKTLIKSGADGSKAIQLAVSLNQKEIVQLLVDYGADLDSKNQSKTTAMRIAINKGYTEISEILIKAGADLSLRGEDGKSYIEAAVEKGEIKTVKALLAYGANVNSKDNNYGDGNSLLDLANSIGNEEIINLVSDAIKKDKQLKFSQNIINQVDQVMRKSSLSFNAITDVESVGTSRSNSPTSLSSNLDQFKVRNR